MALAFLSFGIWVHHMFTVGIPHLALAFFSAGSAIVAVPTAVQIFAWLATLAHGRPRWNVPMLYVFGFFFIFVMGGLTGVMLAMVPFDWQAHDTYFVVAHMHYVVAGALAFPMLAAFYYWLPLLTGRTAVHRLSVPAFWLVFIGFNLTFFMMHLTGLLGMPRRIYTYQGNEGWNWLNLLSSVGGFVMTIGFALVVIDLFVQLRYGRRVRRNPWGAATLEWAMSIPPAPYAFASIPHLTRTDAIAPGDLALSLARGEGYLGFTRNGWQETLGVNMTTGEPEQLIVLPQPTYLPLFTALATAAAVLTLLFKFYLLSLVAALVTAGMFVFSGHRAGLARDFGPIPVGQGVNCRLIPRWPKRRRGWRSSARWSPTALCSHRCCSGPSIFGSRRRIGPRRSHPNRAACSPSSPSRLLPWLPRRRADLCERSPPVAGRVAGLVSPCWRFSRPSPPPSS